MSTNLILNQSQAEAVYSAMCALNNVSGALCCRMDGVRIEAWDAVSIDDGQRTENYPTQSAFATAYGLDHGGEYPNAVAAAAGGLTQTAIER